MIRYTDKKGREHVCTEEEWQAIEARMAKFKLLRFTRLGEFNPAVVKHVEPKEPKRIKVPRDIQLNSGDSADTNENGAA